MLNKTIFEMRRSHSGEDFVCGFWVVTSCGVARCYQHLGGTYRLQMVTNLLSLLRRRRQLLRNVGNLLQNKVAPRLKRPRPIKLRVF
jgi:DNA-binding HxlR family transcriptional regulator